MDNFVVSTGADQKIGLWRWTTVSDDKLTVKVELVSFYRSCIPDIHGLDVNLRCE